MGATPIDLANWLTSIDHQIPARAHLERLVSSACVAAAPLRTAADPEYTEVASCRLPALMFEDKDSSSGS
jgi:hypothetical protein